MDSQWWVDGVTGGPSCQFNVSCHYIGFGYSEGGGAVIEARWLCVDIAGEAGKDDDAGRDDSQYDRNRGATKWCGDDNCTRCAH